MKNRGTWFCFWRQLNYSFFILHFAFLWSVLQSAHAQEGGTVSGVVVSTWDGTPLPGAVVTVRGTTLAAQTDGTGRYELKNVPSGDQVLRISKSGFATAVVTDVRVLLGQTTTVNGNLRPEFYEMEEYEVTAEEVTEQSEQILFERQQSSVLLDAIGSDQISKLGAGDAAEALSKVTGASIAEGKFAVIRGLADRYTSTTLNGVEMPSADPDRKAAQLDLIPSKVISRIDVNKTFSPDSSGGFAGGAINIVTRTVPEEFEFAAEAGVSYNTQSSLRSDFLITDHGKSDWRAKDDGTRSLPGGAAATSPVGDTGGLPASQFDQTIKASYKSKSTQFAPVSGDSSVNSGFFMALGDSFKLFEGSLGYAASLTYKNNYSLYADGKVYKYEPNFFTPTGVAVLQDKDDARGVIEYTWSATLSLGHQINENHELGYNFMYVQTAEDEARRLVGQDSVINTQPGVSYMDQSILHWTERNLTYNQLRGGHQFPSLNDTRFDWVGALSTTTQDEPDHRIFQFFAQPNVPEYLPNGATEPSRPTRFYRDLQEDNTSLRGDFTIPVPSYNEKENAFKTGVAYSHSEREYNSRAFDVRMLTGHPFQTTGDPQDYLAEENEPFIAYYNFPNNFVYTGEQTIPAGYLMGDWHAFEWLRLVGGVRYESTELTVGGKNTTQNSPFSSEISQDDLLPSLASTFHLRENLLLRFAWSETVVRPTYREISPAPIYDIAKSTVYSGNPGLTLSSSENYDLRLEWFPHAGSLIAVSGFMKKITDPIELRSQDVDNSQVTYSNYEEADVQGVEFEIRENLGNLWQPLEDFTFGFNAAYIESEVALTPTERSVRGERWGDTSTDRPLYDQPEYIINGDLTWEFKASRTTLTVAGGVVGPRLVLVGLGGPDEYEQPAPQLDVFLSQKLGKNWKVKFSARNLLNPDYEVVQDWPRAGELVRRSYTKGMTFGLTVGCEF